MALDHYYHYWRTARGMGAEQARQRQRKIRASSDISGTWGSGGDPIGAQTPAAQNKLLEHLSKMAAGRIDDWESLIDPTLPYGHNKATLLDNGASKPKTDVERERRTKLKDAESRAKRHARETIVDYFDEIEAGAADDLVADISDEFSDEFVESVLEMERIDRETAGNGELPDPPEVSDEPAETDDVPAPEPAETPVEPVSVSRSTEPADTVDETETVEPSPTRRKPDYSGILGTVRLLMHWILASHESGRKATEQPAKQTKLNDY